MSQQWADLQRDRGLRVSRGIHRPTLVVEVDPEGERWSFRIPQWGLVGQAESLEGVEAAARDLIARSVRLNVVGDAEAARENPPGDAHG